MSAQPEPNLAAPGAGLPVAELCVARLLFTVLRWTGSRRSFDARFERERERIRALIRTCDAEAGSRRVLIRRVRGLEDSSRYWSVWMTLDHLRIVHLEIARVIGSLASCVVPVGTASTAALKPSAEAGPGVVTPFEVSCDALASLVTSIPDLNARVRFPHPWFGPLNAAGWHLLAGGYLGIHHVQIERILSGLAAEGVPVHSRNAEQDSLSSR